MNLLLRLIPVYLSQVWTGLGGRLPMDNRMLNFYPHHHHPLPPIPPSPQPLYHTWRAARARVYFCDRPAARASARACFGQPAGCTPRPNQWAQCQWALAHRAWAEQGPSQCFWPHSARSSGIRSSPGPSPPAPHTPHPKLLPPLQWGWGGVVVGQELRISRSLWPRRAQGEPIGVGH